MICRIWSGRTADTAGADAYQRVFETTVLDELRGVEGFRAAYLLRRDLEVVTLTMFESLSAIRAFAGENDNLAHVTAPARAVLASFDRDVRHFTVAVSA